MLADTNLFNRIQQSLCCPVCQSKLELSDEQIFCTNFSCGSVFPVVNSIPVLIDEEASVFSHHDFTHRRPTFYGSSQSNNLVRILDRVLPDLHRTNVSSQNYHKLAALLLAQSQFPVVLVIGGSTLGRGMEPLLNHCPPIQLVESDVSLGPRTALICDAHQIPFENETFDGVIAQAVLEHVVDPWRCVSEIHRVLKKEGLVYVQTPFMQQVHGRQYDFTRFTHLGHRRLFRRFEELESGVVDGPGTALAWSYQYFLLSFARSRVARSMLRAFARVTSFYLKYFDYYLARNAGALDAASGYYFIGRKSDLALPDKELVTLYQGALIS